MRISSLSKAGKKTALIRHSSAGLLAALLFAVIGSGGDPVLCRAQEVPPETEGAQVLTRGPVHEAFAGIISFNAQPGIVISKAPPEPLEEIPPGERPEGDDVTWIPGYWAWDDERNDFLWVSGIWRALPPGREWRVGYWNRTVQGYQWISGYWADATTEETTYLPEPPATVEEGPNIEAPSEDYAWTPGCWIWHQQRYAWSPGYWARGRPDWNWNPAHYVWTPRGYVFVEGFWDYSLERRGVLFAPVYFEPRFYSRPGYAYSPSIVIDLALFAEHLFVRPRYDHYYFGDYYAPDYHRSGFYTAFSYQSSRRGYDPFYAHRRWQHRQDREWEQRIERDYQRRRDHENERPPRTWTAQRQLQGGPVDSRQDRPMLATSFDQLTKRKGNAQRFQPVAREDREQLARRGKDLQKSREQRRTLEIAGADDPKRGKKSEPAKVTSARSPIVAKSGKDSKGKQAPPEPQRAPKPDVNPPSKPEARNRPAKEEKGRPPSEPRKAGTPEKKAPARGEPAPREKRPQTETPQPAKGKAKQEPRQTSRPSKDPQPKSRQEPAQPPKTKAKESSPPRPAREPQPKSRQEPAQPPKAKAKPAASPPPRPAREPQRKAQPEPTQPSKGKAKKSPQDPEAKKEKP